MFFAAAAAVSLGIQSPAGAILTVSLEAFSASGNTRVVGPNLVQLGSVGDTVTFRLFATITGSDSDPANDGVVSLCGSFLSSGGSARGNLQVFRTPDTATNIDGVQGVSGLGFIDRYGSNGTQADLDGDGDLDVGSNDPSNVAGFLAARATSAPAPNFPLDGNPAGTSGNPFSPRLLVATVKMLVTELGTGTTVNFRKRESTVGALWVEDSHITNVPPDGPPQFSGAQWYVPGGPDNWLVGAGVLLDTSPASAPEPTSLGLIGCGGISLISRRRRH